MDGPLTLSITVQRRLGSTWPLVLQWIPSGTHVAQRRDGVLDLEPSDLVAVPDAREYGLFLGRRVFVDSLRSGFESAVSSAPGPVHVLIVLEDPEAESWRWERLCGPLDAGWRPLALTTKTPLAIHQPSLVDVHLPPLDFADLRALVVVANPTGLEEYALSPFDAEMAASSVRSAIGDVPSELLSFTGDAIGPPTLDALCERLAAQPTSILHIVCHGRRQQRTGETVLYLGGVDGEVEPVPGTLLIDRLGGATGSSTRPRLIFLASCETAAPAAAESLASLAPRLVRELGIPAVVAMTEQVTVKTALAASRAFYGRLRTHGQADLALSEAGAGMAGRHDILVPALYSLMGGQSIFKEVRRSEADRGPTFETVITGGTVGKVVNIGDVKGPVSF